MAAGELDGADQWLADYTRRVAEIQQRAEQVQADLKSVRARASSPDGTVSVVLAPGGRLESLDLTPRALEAGHQRLARIIADTIRAAHDQAGAQTQEALSSLVGGESSAMEFLRDQFESARQDEPSAEQAVANQPSQPGVIGSPTQHEPPNPPTRRSVRPATRPDDEEPLYGDGLMR